MVLHLFFYAKHFSLPFYAPVVKEKFVDLLLENVNLKTAVFAAVARAIAGKARVPVAIHLDHGDSFELCRQAAWAARRTAWR